MATVNDVKNQVQTLPPQKTLKELVRAATMELGKALPAHMNPERIVRIALTALNQNPELAKCTPDSFMGSLFVLAQIGLEPIAGRAYLLPYNNKRKINGEWKTVKEVQALIGYKGLADLFYRSDSALSIDMQTVNANDEFDYQYGTQPFLKHKPNDKDRGPVRGYYAVALLRGGGTVFKYLTEPECLEHGRKHSKTWVDYEWENGKKVKCEPHWDKHSPWFTDPDSMCKKTVLIQLAKVLPLSIELQRAISIDETSRDYRYGLKNALEAPTTTNWDEDVGMVNVGPEIEKKGISSDSKGISEFSGKPSDYLEGPNGEIIGV